MCQRRTLTLVDERMTLCFVLKDCLDICLKMNIISGFHIFNTLFRVYLQKELSDEVTFYKN